MKRYFIRLGILLLGVAATLLYTFIGGACMFVGCMPEQDQKQFLLIAALSLAPWLFLVPLRLTPFKIIKWLEKQWNK